MSDTYTSKQNPISILIVDDQQQVRQTVCEMLELERDFRVVGQGSNGYQGVALALQLRPDIILMNYSMPMMDGVEATRRITRLIPDAVVIMFSVSDDLSVVDAAFNAGAKAYFVKSSLPLEEFYATIRLANEQRKAVAVSHSSVI